MSRLSGTELDTAVAGLEGWEVTREGLAISRTFRFPDFTAAFAFMTAGALYAERKDHHPEWSNVYSTVEVTWTSHDAGGVTSRDIEAATAMNARYQQ